MVFDSFLVITTEEIEADTVLSSIEDVEQTVSQLGPLSGIDLTFEDRVLYPLTIVETDLGDLGKSLASGGVGSRNVIGDQYKQRELYFQMKAG